MPSELESLVTTRPDHVRLHGSTAKQRYSDEQLRVLGDWPVEKAILSRHHITALPPFQPTLKTLLLADMTSLSSLAGIERMTSLQWLQLDRLPALDLDAALELIAELPELTELRLMGFPSMPARIASLPSVLSLSVQSAPETDLTAMFATLGSIPTLRNLYVHGPDLVPPDALAPLSSIELLAITGRAAVFPPSIGELSNLVKLYFGEGFQAIPPSIGKLQKLVELNVSKNPITVAPDELCDCSALEVLDLDGTLITALPEQIGRLSRLRVLRVANQKLKSFPTSIGRLAELRELWVPWRGTGAGGKLKIPDELFDLRLERFVGPPEILERLTLRPPPTPQTDRVRLSNKERLPADFGDPVDLELNISEHGEPLPQLSALRRLKKLKIDTANLEDAFERLATAPYLTSIEILGMHRELPASLCALTQIERLVIDAGQWGHSRSDSVLETLPETIGALVDLKHLAILRNALVALPDALGQLRALEELVLHTNQITALPDAIGMLPSLRALTIADARLLERLPSTFAGCAALAKVVIDGGFGAVDHPLANLDSLATAPSLTSLALPKLHLASFDALEPICAAGKLEEVDLQGSNVRQLPASIGRLRKLRTLRFDGTEVTRLPESLRDCTELREIVVSSVLDENVRANIKSYLPEGRWKTTKRAPSWYTRSG